MAQIVPVLLAAVTLHTATPGGQINPHLTADDSQAQRTEMACFKSHKCLQIFVACLLCARCALCVASNPYGSAAWEGFCISMLLMRKQAQRGGDLLGVTLCITHARDLGSGLSTITNKQQRQQLLWVLLRLAANVDYTLAWSQALC